jgi:hypothetical protein
VRIAVPLRDTGGFLGRFRKSGWLSAASTACELLADARADRSFGPGHVGPHGVGAGGARHAARSALGRG